MKRRKNSLVLIFGIIMISVSFSLIIALQVRIHIGTEKSQRVIAEMKELLPEKIAGVAGAYPSLNMPVLEIGGVDYSAVLEIPSVGVALPVADKWNGNKLYLTPARYYGSAYQNTLVIGGEDSQGQFFFCSKIDIGDIVTVTDMTGALFTYRVSCVERSKKAENTWLIDKEHALTLFCRDFYSMEYIAVRCDINYN